MTAVSVLTKISVPISYRHCKLKALRGRIITLSHSNLPVL